MTQTRTKTETYTVADVKNVFENVLSDLAMIVRSTELWSSAHLQSVSEDIRLLSEAGYLRRLDIVLCDENGVTVKAHRYDVSTEASRWSNAEPRGNIWSGDGKKLNLVIFWNDDWAALSEARQQSIRSSLRIKWSASDVDTTYGGLASVSKLQYSSQSFGVERQTFEGGE